MDESMLSGEPIPVEKGGGDKVSDSTVTSPAAFSWKLNASAARPLLSQIIDVVAHAQRSRAPIQGLADKVAGWRVPAVLAISLLTFAAWPWLGRSHATRMRS